MRKKPAIALFLLSLGCAHAAAPIRIAWTEGPEYPMGIQDSAFAVLNGKVISAGGFTRHPKDVLKIWPDTFAGAKSGFTKAVFLFDPQHAERGWTRIADIPGPARQAAAAVVVGDALYAIGGFSYSPPYSYRSTYRLREEAGGWVWSKLEAELPWPLCEAGVAVIGSKIYLQGGADFYTSNGAKDHDFNAERGRGGEPVGRALLVLDTAHTGAGWQRLVDSPGTPRFDNAVSAAGGKIYVLSGVYRGSPATSKHYCNVTDSWVYDPATARWAGLPEYPQDSNQRAVPYGDRYVLLVGGYRYGATRRADGTETQIYTPAEKRADWKQFFERTVRVFDTETNRLADIDPLPDQTSQPMAAAGGDTVYVLGGEGGTRLWHPATFFIGHISRAQEQAAAVQTERAGGAQVITHLFTNWYGTDPGTAVFRLDRTQVDAGNLAILEQVKDYYRIRFSDGDSPPERVNVPVGVKLRAEMASKSEPWLKPERPWESGGIGVGTVIQDGGRYRAWYGCGAAGRDKVVVLPNGRRKLGSEEGSAGLCYAESEDGFHWNRPSLGLVAFGGSKDNNIVTDDPMLRGGTIFVDPPALAGERYKMVSNTDIRHFQPDAKTNGPLLGGAVSADGIHWQSLPEPLWRDVFNNDGSPQVYHDLDTGKYVLFTRANYPRRRSIARAQTTDFRHWPQPEIILTPGPDEDPSDDFYDNPYLQYPGAVNGHLMLVSTYHRDTSLVDMRLASSMDGAAWNWLSPRTVVALGPRGAWDGGMLFAVPNMVRLPDGRVAVPFQGYSSAHEEYWRVKFERGRARREYAGWAIWEDGRMAGIEAEKSGEFTTLPLRATGRPIEVNARTGYSGSVRVEVFAEGAKPALRSYEMTGDLRWRQPRWEQGDPTALAGKTVRLRFLLYNAKVFGVRGDGLEIVSPYARK